MKADIKILNNEFFEEFGVPKYATEGSAGLDLKACIDGPVIIEPHETVMIGSGISIHLDNPELAGFLMNRSGLSAKQNIGIINSVGLIDSDYTGEIMIPLHNYGKKEYTVNRGDRVAQYVCAPVHQLKFNVLAQHKETKRGENGFGHTGR